MQYKTIIIPQWLLGETLLEGKLVIELPFITSSEVSS